MKRRFLLMAVLAAPLGGCAVFKPVYTFERTGRFAVKRQTPDGNRGQSGRFCLTKNAGLIRLDLMTPLNGVLARIEITPNRAVLTNHKGQSRTAASGEQLLLELTGLHLPVDHLIDLLSDPRDNFSFQNWNVSVLRRDEKARPLTIRIKSTSVQDPIIFTLAMDPIRS